MIAYKVVRMTKYGKLISGTDYGSVTEYKIKKITKPNEKTGPLAAFKTLKAAKRFIYLMDRTLKIKLFKCLIKQSLDTYVHYILKLSNERTFVCCLPIESLPTNTILCSEITLLEEIKI